MASSTARWAFTLAEVLITLGVIGVVAALTMPSLIANYKKQVYVTQLKKSISTIEQGLQKLMAADDVTSLSLLSKPVFGYRSCEKSGAGNSGEKGLLSYNVFQFAEAPKNQYGTYCIEHDDGLYDNKFEQIISDDVTDWEGDGYYLQDGTLFGIETGYNYNNVVCEDNTKLWASMWLDINGDKKGPNVKGRDIFFFYVLDTGLLLPKNSRPLVCSDAEGTEYVNEKNWKDMGNSGCTGDDTKTNEGCAARIIEKGWKMDY